MFAPSPSNTKTLSLADLSLIHAVETFDMGAVEKALADGGRPSVCKPYRGLSGEPLTLMAVRRGQYPLLDVLLNAGAPVHEGLAMAAALLVERATRAGDEATLAQAHAIVQRLEELEIDWGVGDRSIGAGLRAIDLLAAAQPNWAIKPAHRQGLEPMGQTMPTPLAHSTARSRR
jgi:hypothetical protein